MTRTRVFIEALELEASIGVLDHEAVARQPLIVDVTLELEGDPWKTGRLETTVDYRDIVMRAEDIIGRGHIQLVEDFAEDLAAACLELPHVGEVTVRAVKPDAVAAARAAGVEITRSRDPGGVRWRPAAGAPSAGD
ncbi:MAG: dihydroneopterin aldolase [bacterium]|nr:dihydroneopterin aldolase [bacterium]MDE0418827.1 dihydroneopterin aldolase [bacterium]